MHCWTSRVIIVSQGRDNLTWGPARSVQLERFLGLADAWSCLEKGGWARPLLCCTVQFRWYRTTGDDAAVGRSRIGILLVGLTQLVGPGGGAVKDIFLLLPFVYDFDYGKISWGFCVRVTIHIMFSSFDNQLASRFITLSWEDVCTFRFSLAFCWVWLLPIIKLLGPFPYSEHIETCICPPLLALACARYWDSCLLISKSVKVKLPKVPEDT